MQSKVVAVVLLIIALLVGGCAQTTAGANDVSKRKIRVVTTTGMIGDIVKNIGGERVQVESLMGPGVDPHLYKATAGDVQKLNNADIIYYNGLELEGRMTDIFVKLARSGKPTYAVTEDIPEDKLLQPDEFEGKFDPHIWFDVTLWQQAVKNVTAQLVKLDPTSAAVYQRNSEAYLAKLGELHTYVTQQSNKIPAQSRVLITAHDAFGYFGKQYGYEVMGLQGTSTATEAGAGDVQELANTIAQRKIKAIFVESSVPKATIEAVQSAVKARGWNVQIGGELFSDAMGADGTPEGTYIGMVRHNIDTIVKALN